MSDVGHNVSPKRDLKLCVGGPFDGAKVARASDSILLTGDGVPEGSDTERLTRDQALAMLRAIRVRQGDDGARIREEDHLDADEVLLRYIADDELAAAFDSIEKWYA